MSRDKFYAFLRSHKLRITRTKNDQITTNSKQHFIKKLI